MLYFHEKLVIVGDEACGKTSLLSTFFNEKFPKQDIPTVFDNHVVNVRVADRIVPISLRDTAGHEDYDRVRPLSYPDASVIMICYSIDAPDSLQNLKVKWNPDIHHLCGNLPIILVGNKVDLRNDDSTVHHLNKFSQKPVTYSEGKEVATDIKACGFFECSAMNNLNVKEVFHEATRAALFDKSSKKRQCVIAAI